MILTPKIERERITIVAFTQRSERIIWIVIVKMRCSVQWKVAVRQCPAGCTRCTTRCGVVFTVSYKVRTAARTAHRSNSLVGSQILISDRSDLTMKWKSSGGSSWEERESCCKLHSELRLLLWWCEVLPLKSITTLELGSGDQRWFRRSFCCSVFRVWETVL